MKKTLTVVTLALAAALALAFAGCGAKGTFASDYDEETGAYTVTAENAMKDSMVAASGGIMVGEGQILVASHDLSKGSLQLKLSDVKSKNADEVAVDEELQGASVSTYQLAPGEYGIGVTCNENGTTGTLMVVAVDSELFQKHGSDLEAALAATASSGSASSASASA